MLSILMQKALVIFKTRYPYGYYYWCLIHQHGGTRTQGDKRQSVKWDTKTRLTTPTRRVGLA